MTTVVTDNCNGCRFTDCVAVCPVECFHYDDNMLYIDPDVCIDCSACIPDMRIDLLHRRKQPTGTSQMQGPPSTLENAKMSAGWSSFLMFTLMDLTCHYASRWDQY